MEAVVVHFLQSSALGIRRVQVSYGIVCRRPTPKVSAAFAAFHNGAARFTPAFLANHDRTMTLLACPRCGDAPRPLLQKVTKWLVCNPWLHRGCIAARRWLKKPPEASRTKDADTTAVPLTEEMWPLHREVIHDKKNRGCCCPASLVAEIAAAAKF